MLAQLTPSDVVTIVGWCICALMSVLGGLIALVVYFLRRLVTQFDSTRASLTALRVQLNELAMRFQLFKMEVRMLLQNTGIDMRALDELESANEFKPPADDGGTG